MPRSSSSSRQSDNESRENGSEARNRGGAPHGNQNSLPRDSGALKHGFYSRQLNRSDLADLQSCTFSGLSDEISLTRILIRQVVADRKTASTLAERLSLSHVFTLLTTSLDRLLKTQAKLAAAENSPLQEINRAIEALAESGDFPILKEGLFKDRPV
jgi:hypothetical protein